MAAEIYKGDHPIGASFGDELVAHGGLIGAHFSWSPDGTLEFFDDTAAEVVAGVLAVYAAHDPNSLAQAKKAQMAGIDASCAAAIVAGFASSALGAAHTYPSKMTDQQNLSASVLASIMPGLPADWKTPFWCADASGAWSYVDHTAAQIQQVGQDGKAAVLACLQKKAQFAAQVEAATTVAAVQAVVWA
ncbi:hypothetical protein RA280_19865 [Cupriavidus sp. CV2]|uniref:DUF4376 domain-containing protein n=1 Tax=Cupriavidus ulmosensis TaxID=3065913 RepID=UPI00296AA612|nr:hypothetical protein [Cupriavidus sp. CV2]MDW3683961.1 hypothetical protein [Cupriavidus sp. CV2]